MLIFHEMINVKPLIIIFTVCCFLLSGCVSPAEFSTDPASQAESSSENAARFPDYVYDPESAEYYSGTYAAVREDGYYLLINSILHFYDIQSDTLFPLCTKASCLHKDKTCDAYCYQERDNDSEYYKNGWAANAYNYWIVYYRDHLYTIGYHPGKGYALFQYSRDFTQQKEMVWLEDFEKAPSVRYIYHSLFFHDQYFYYVTYLYQEDKVQEIEYETVFTVWRVDLEGEEEAEELFTFNGANSASQGIRTCGIGDEVYFIIEQESQYFVPEEERKTGDSPIQVSGGSGKVFRYDEKKNYAELVWSYSGDQMVSLFEAEGAIPRNMYSGDYYLNAAGDYLVNEEGDYVYLAGYPEVYEGNLTPTSISMVNLKTGEGKVLYETPYQRIEQLISDGRYYYFIEIAKGYTYLTAIDRAGNLIRRYEMPLDETFIEGMETRKLPRGEWTSGWLRLLVTDGRYITLGGYGGSIYKNLSSRVTNMSLKLVDEGIGVIDADDFLNGKKVEIRQIYERRDPAPFN